MRSVRSLWCRLIRFGFRLLYNEFAFTYDLVSKVVSLGSWGCWQRAALKYVNPDGLILELAHGTGNLQIDLIRAGHQTVGYDLSPQMGRMARLKLLRHKLTPRLTRGVAQRLPFRNSQFSSVVSTFPSDFIVAKETLEEIHRVLKDGGLLVIVPSASFTGGGVAKAVLEWLYRITGQQSSDAPADDSRLHGWFVLYGFEVSTHREPCQNSVALVIVARKKLQISPE